MISGFPIRKINGQCIKTYTNLDVDNLLANIDSIIKLEIPLLNVFKTPIGKIVGYGKGVLLVDLDEFYIHMNINKLAYGIDLRGVYIRDLHTIHLIESPVIIVSDT